MRSINSNKGQTQHWFNVADILIVIIALAMLTGAAILFLFPDSDMVKEYVSVNATLLVSVEEAHTGALESLNDKDRIYTNNADTGFVVTKDMGNGTVLLDVNMQFSDGVYYLGGSPLRVNGSITVETKLIKLEGTVMQIMNKEG